MSFINRYEQHLDRFMPAAGEKCSLGKCLPGKIWFVLAILSVAGSASMGWRHFIGTLIWEMIVGWGISWLCRGCHYGWLWTLLVIFAGIPLIVVGGAMFLLKDDKVSCPACEQKTA